MKEIDNNDKPKRGRPKKIIDKSSEPKKQEQVEYPIVEDLILKLPISLKSTNTTIEFSSDMEDTNTVNDNQDQDQDKDDIFTSFMMSDSDKMKPSSSNNNELYDIINELKEEIKTKDRIILKLKQENSKYAINVNNPTSYIKIDLKLIDNNGVLTDKTDIPCWWCGYKFENKPFLIPDKIFQDSFYVFGCFCTSTCAAAYNMYELNDYKSTDRHSLINEISRIMGISTPVLCAPPRERFERLGGDLKIEDYRKNNNNIQNSKLLLPPMIPLIPSVEEKSGRNTNIIHQNNSRPVKKSTIFDSFNI